MLGINVSQVSFKLLQLNYYILFCLRQFKVYLDILVQYIHAHTQNTISSEQFIILEFVTDLPALSRFIIVQLQHNEYKCCCTTVHLQQHLFNVLQSQIIQNTLKVPVEALLRFLSTSSPRL